LSSRRQLSPNGYRGISTAGTSGEILTTPPRRVRVKRNISVVYGYDLVDPFSEIKFLEQDVNRHTSTRYSLSRKNRPSLRRGNPERGKKPYLYFHVIRFAKME